MKKPAPNKVAPVIDFLDRFVGQWALLVAVPAVIVLIAGQARAGDEVQFSRDIRPILADNCFECHGPDEESRGADLRLDELDEAIGWVIEPGSAAKSELVARLLSDDPDSVMPPPHSPRRPTPEQIDLLRRWIDNGAEYEQHWAFIPPQRPPVPTIDDPSWVRNPIDHFVASHLQQESLLPSEDAPPRLLARRLSLVLTGLPMMPEEADRFVDDYRNNAERAVSSLVDQLLASESYGEHRAWFWMDAARYADTNGYQGDGYRIMWPWRDWLIRSLNSNMPFEQMTRQMLAGDLMIPAKYRDWESADWIPDQRARELVLATGFLRNHRYDTGSGTIPDESKFENAADRMETVGTVWMGMTMLCARCHTHKYDPIENHEYYQLLSFFDNVPEVGSALRAASHPYIRVPTERQAEELKRLREKMHDAEQAMVNAEPAIAAEQDQWEHKIRQDGNFGARLDPAMGDVQRVLRGLRYHYAKSPMELDGANSIEESNDPIALCAGDKRWTISFHFRADSDQDGAIFSSVDEPERYRPGIQADWVNGKIRVRHVCRWVNSYIEFESRQKLRVGQWYHVTLRCDGRIQGLAYSATLDGSESGMHCTHPVTNDSATKTGKAPLVIGGSPLMPGMVGRLSDLRFYDRDLRPGEIWSLADRRSISDIAKKPPQMRSAEESRILRLSFLENEHLSKSIAKLRDQRIHAREAFLEAIEATPTAMVMKDSTTEPTQVRLAGVFDSLGERVDSGTPQFLPPLPSEKPNRLSLANWLTQPDHPLTARVAVNRVWQTLWGQGFVDSPENFGTQTAKPLQADLLDWLATEYMRNGWDTKALIKLIVTSRAYRQRSDATKEMWSRDPNNRHLARGPRYRLPIHTVRDQALYLSGRLNRQLGGPPVIVDEVIGQNGKVVKLPFESDSCRRTLYTFWKRNSPHPMLAVFDVADRNQCEVRSMRTNTPLQALVTLNEPGFAAAAKALGKRAAFAGETLDEQVKWVWQACTGRVPSSADTPTLARMWHEYLQLADGDEEQAWTAFCNVLLNLDATLTLE